MNKYTAITLCWALAIFAACWAIYVTKSGWWLLILAIYDLEIGGDDNGKEKKDK